MAQRLMLSLLFTSSIACGGHAGNESPRLIKLAQQAKAEGRNSISTSFIPERDTHSTLQDVRRAASIVIATSTGTSRVRIDDRIITTQDFRVERWLNRRVGNCASSWPGVSEDKNLVSLRLFKGTAVVDDVSITELTDDGIEFPEGQRFLLLVRDCGDRRIELSYWSNSIFVVSGRGQIVVPRDNQMPVPFVKEIAELKTISALEQAIETGPDPIAWTR